MPVSWNTKSILAVAPLTGAWIEMTLIAAVTPLHPHIAQAEPSSSRQRGAVSGMELPRAV